MMKNLLLTTCALSFLLSLPQTARACFCSFIGGVESAFASSEAVFVGKVVKIKTVKEASVGLLVKESGTLETLKTPRWQKSIKNIRSVTLEIIELFKGDTVKTFVLTTEVYNGGGSCGVPFKVGESYLVFAHKSQPAFSMEEAAQAKENWTPELRLKAEADKFNEQLPPYQTNICTRTDRLRFMKEKIETIRGFLTTGVWKESEQQLPTRVVN